MTTTPSGSTCAGWSNGALPAQPVETTARSVEIARGKANDPRAPFVNGARPSTDNFRNREGKSPD